MTLEEFKQKLIQQIEYYKEIDKLSDKENELINQKELLELKKVLEMKQEIITKIGEIEVKIKNSIKEFEQEPEIVKVGKELATILNQVLKKEKENQELLVEKMKEIKTEMTKLQEHKYQKRTVTPRFINKKR